MSATVAQMRAGLAANLSTISDVQVSAYILGQPTFPTIWVIPHETDYDETMGRGLDLFKFTVQAMAGLIADQGSQMVLDQMLDPTDAMSVKTAIESDRTLGGTVETLRVVRQSGYQIYEWPKIRGMSYSHGQLIAAEWEVDVYT